VIKSLFGLFVAGQERAVFTCSKLENGPITGYLVHFLGAEQAKNAHQRSEVKSQISSKNTTHDFVIIGGILLSRNLG